MCAACCEISSLGRARKIAGDRAKCSEKWRHSQRYNGESAILDTPLDNACWRYLCCEDVSGGGGFFIASVFAGSKSASSNEIFLLERDLTWCTHAKGDCTFAVVPRYSRFRADKRGVAWIKRRTGERNVLFIGGKMLAHKNNSTWSIGGGSREKFVSSIRWKARDFTKLERD